MPELPEVETIRRQLSSEIVGEKIVGVEVRREKCFRGDSKSLQGEVIEKISRVGKYLFMYFESGRGLSVHLRMTGRLVIGDTWYAQAPHTRVVVELFGGRSLYYWDMRTFGYMQVEEGIEKAVRAVSKKLGPDPWEIGENELMGKLKRTCRAVKDAILDQDLLSGVGNIYANDGLHLAGILPQRKASAISKKESEKLLDALREVMELGLSTNGASDNSYVDARGKKGAYQNEFRVYGKTGGVCVECERQLEYGKVGGRGTWWCRQCQV